MDHKLAATRHSVEKYTLNELSPDERTQFEEHMFDCPICSDIVRQNFTVMENLKEVLQEAPLQERVSWRDWLRVPSLAPAFAALALACVVGYQNVGSGAPEMARVLPQVAPLRPNSRGAVKIVTVDRKSQRFVLPISADLPPGPFECELDNPDGKKMMPSMQGQKLPDVNLVDIEFMTKSLPAGRYTLVFRSASSPTEAIPYTFEVQDSK